MGEQLETELHDVFQVRQVTRETSLEHLVGADVVTLDEHMTSQIHRHNRSDTVLYILEGSGTIVIDAVEHQVGTGERVHIAPGAFHGVRTGDSTLKFLSVQSPPILDRSTGVLDLEVLVSGTTSR
jgi:quercetin dioxygenase-like cupin family protein